MFSLALCLIFAFVGLGSDGVSNGLDPRTGVSCPSGFVVTSAESSIFRFSALSVIPDPPVRKRVWATSPSVTNEALGEFRSNGTETSPNLRWPSASYTDGDEGPQAVRVGIDGAVYVLSGDAEKIYRYSSNGATVKLFISGLCEAYNFIFGSDGNLYVADHTDCDKKRDHSSNRVSNEKYLVKKFNGITGEFMGYFTSEGFYYGTKRHDDHFGWMTAMSFGPDGDLYVACTEDSLKKRVSADPNNYAFRIARFNGLTGAFIGFFWDDSLPHPDLQGSLLIDTHDMIWHVNSATGAYQLYVGSKDRIVRFDRPIAPTVAASLPQSANWVLSSIPDAPLGYAFGLMWHEDALLVVDNKLIESPPEVNNGVTTTTYATVIRRYEVDADGNGVETPYIFGGSYVNVNTGCSTANSTGTATPTTQCGLLCSTALSAQGIHNKINNNYWACSGATNRWVNQGTKEPWTYGGLYHPQYIASLSCGGKKCQGCSGVTGEN